MITLYTYVPAWGTPDLSPFVGKVETYLRMAGMPFRKAVGDPRKAPKEKLPYIDDDGTIICDSRAIIEHLEKKNPSPLDAGLGPVEHGISVAFRGMIEEELYFYVLRLRWGTDEGWRVYTPILRQYAAAAAVPRFLQPVLLPMIRRQVVRNCWGQGAGRHSVEDIDARMQEGIRAITEQLADRPFFVGDTPRVIDATVYAFVQGLLLPPFESRARDFARGCENLNAYVERMTKAYFSDAAGGAQGASAAAAAE